MTRDALRTQSLAALSPRYSPLLHVLVPLLWGTSVMAVCAFLVDDLRPLQLLTIPLVLVFSNATEWRLHRDALHKRWRVLPALYDRHTPVHHRVYVHDDMELRDFRELALILIPPWAGMALFFALLPLAAGLWFFVAPNVAALFMATCMFYVVSYELLHMSYHLPRTSLVGRNPIIRALARHHSIHHDPRHMQRWNMNVTLPLWDIVRRTRLSPLRAESRTGGDACATVGSSPLRGESRLTVPAGESSAPAAAPAIQ